MANTYSQIYLHFIFAVKGRENLLKKSWRGELFQYMSGIVASKNHKSIIVNGVEDHVHILIGFNPSMSPSELIRDVKNNSSKFINEKKWIKGNFSWQNGYGVFSHSRKEVEYVYAYIAGQELHHRKTTFREEYIATLNDYNIEYNERFLFEDT